MLIGEHLRICSSAFSLQFIESMFYAADLRVAINVNVLTDSLLVLTRTLTASNDRKLSDRDCNISSSITRQVCLAVATTEWYILVYVCASSYINTTRLYR